MPHDGVFGYTTQPRKSRFSVRFCHDFSATLKKMMKTWLVFMCPHALTHESTKSEIDGHLSRLEGDLSTIGSSWQGAAATQFQSLMNQWHENATKVNRALQDLADNLRATDSSMTHNESETESSFTTLLGGMQ